MGMDARNQARKAFLRCAGALFTHRMRYGLTWILGNMAGEEKAAADWGVFYTAVGFEVNRTSARRPAQRVFQENAEGLPQQVVMRKDITFYGTGWVDGELKGAQALSAPGWQTGWEGLMF